MGVTDLRVRDGEPSTTADKGGIAQGDIYNEELAKITVRSVTWIDGSKSSGDRGKSELNEKTDTGLRQ